MKKALLTAALLFAAAWAGAQKVGESVIWKNILSHPAPLPVAGRIVPVHSDLSVPSRWSVGVETLDRDFADFSKFHQFIGETGVGYGRLQSGWAKTEKKKGKYDFTWLDEHVDGLLAQGVHPWMCLCYGNPIYSEHGMGLGSKLFPDGPVMDGWLRYVRAIVTRYKGKVSMWEIWNEPDNSRNLKDYPLYANLFVRTAKVIREVDPQAKIAAFASCSPDRKFIRQAMELIAQADGVKYIDYITVHAYWLISETVVPALQQLRADIDAYNPNIEILQGEAGCHAHLEYSRSVLKDVDWTETSQAKWELRHMINFFSQGIPYSVFTMVDLQYDWKLQCMGLIRMDLKKNPVYKRPKFHVVQHMASVLTPDIVPAAGVSVKYTVPRDIQCFGLGKDGQTIGCALWFGGQVPTPSLERTLVDINLTGLSLKDPVYVDLMTGYVHELSGLIYRGSKAGNGLILSGIPLWDCPVLILERSALASCLGTEQKNN